MHAWHIHLPQTLLMSLRHGMASAYINRTSCIERQGQMQPPNTTTHAAVHLLVWVLFSALCVVYAAPFV